MSANKRSRTERERMMSGTVSAACFDEGDTPRAIAAKASVLGMRTRRAKQAHTWKCAEPCFVPHKRKRRCDNKDSAVAIAFDWLHSDSVCPPRSADTRDLRVIPVGDGMAMYHQRRVRFKSLDGLHRDFQEYWTNELQRPKADCIELALFKDKAVCPCLTANQREKCVCPYCHQAKLYLQRWQSSRGDVVGGWRDSRVRPVKWKGKKASSRAKCKCCACQGTSAVRKCSKAKPCRCYHDDNMYHRLRRR